MVHVYMQITITDFCFNKHTLYSVHVHYNFAGTNILSFIKMQSFEGVIKHNNPKCFITNFEIPNVRLKSEIL